MRRALISVSDKTGVVDFARGLEELGYEIVSTGGTYDTLRGAGVRVVKVAEVTGFAEILDGRVKTLHPAIHGGILARRTPEHLRQLEACGISTIDVVAVNLYPFRETVQRPGVTLEEAVENIDIGGPAMVRAAAKNFESVLVVVKPSFYPAVLDHLRAGAVDAEFRMRLALEAYTHTAAYDAMVSEYLRGLLGIEFADTMVMAGEKLYDLRYGENPHQKAAFYRQVLGRSGLPLARQLNGKELSYNNILDAEAALALVCEFEQPACVIVKHNNPCGVALADDAAGAFERAFAADPLSAFGGIVAVNRVLDEVAAARMVEPFLEVIVAPQVEAPALEVLRQRPNLRVLEVPTGGGAPYTEWRTVEGGFVMQSADRGPVEVGAMQQVTRAGVSEQQRRDMVFGWHVMRYVKSNAIVVVRDGVTLGIGAGQMNRVGAARLALEQAGEKAAGAVMVSDAFFPFKDTVELAARYGISAILQPGGSVRDAESIEECDRHGIAMVFTGQRHFKH